jgi:uncharacterized protein YdbL (DUF1318 family)
MFDRLKKFILRPAERPAGKESTMPEGTTDTTATPPATSGGITQEQLNAAIASALEKQAKATHELIAKLQADQKVLADTIAAQKPIAAEDVQKLVGQTLVSQQADAQKKTAIAKVRGEWLAKNAPKLPAIYQAQIPETEDAAAIEEAGKNAIAQFEADYKASGLTPQSPAAPAGGNAPAGEASTGGFLKMPGTVSAIPAAVTPAPAAV